MNYWLCKYYFGRHKKKLIATSDDYITNIKDDGKTIQSNRHIIRFYVCDNCNTRWVKVSGDDWKSHSGIRKAIDDWEEVGILPRGSTLFNKEYFIKQMELMEELYK